MTTRRPALGPLDQDPTVESQTSVCVEGLRFSYPPLAPTQDAPWVINGLDLRISRGEWLAVMGASDVGKTTLCLLLAGLAPHLTGGRMEGQVVVAGRDTAQHPPPALALTIGVLFQEPEAQLFNATVEAEVAWGLENLGLPVPEIEKRMEEALALGRLDHAHDRPPSQLSGGEKKRLALATVLAMQPSVLILDEPMGELDPIGRRDLLAALSTLRSHAQEHPVTIVMAESDPEAVGAFADRLVILENGHLVLDGPPKALFQRPVELAKLGVSVPQMALVADSVNQNLGTGFDFLTIDEAKASLAVHLA